MQLTFYKRSVLALLIFAAFNILIGQFSNIDLMIEDYYFDATTHQFPWKNTWFANDFMHGYVKRFIFYVGRALLLVVMLDFIFSWYKPFQFIGSWLRLRLRFLAIAMVIISSTVGWIKHFSTLHCPWDVARYGGFAPFLRLFDTVPNNLQSGHCFPAGHATVGLWLAALCVFWLPHKLNTAFAVFILGLSVRLVLGWVQQMRGAHFLFHTLWSTWIAASVIVIMLSFSKQLLKTALEDTPNVTSLQKSQVKSAGFIQ